MDHDVFLHLSLIKIAFKTWSPSLPIMSNQTLQGYNQLLDYLMYLLSLTGLSAEIIYAIIFPLIYLLSVTILMVYLFLKQNKSISYIFFLLFFIFFGGSFGFLFTLYHSQTFDGASSSLAMQALLTLTNLQFALSLVFVLIILLVLKEKTFTKKNSLVLGMLLSITLGLKFYGGLISVFLVFFYSFLKEIKINKKTKRRYCLRLFI